MWTSTLDALLRILVTAACGYVGLVILLRVSGKRTLSKWNAFDFVVTIALGSLLATLVLSDRTSIAEGLLALAALVVLQLVVSFLSVRIPWFDRAVKAKPALLLYRGEVLHEALRRERVSEAELYGALRGYGLASLEEAEAVVLETDGSFTVLEHPARGDHPTLKDVRGFET